MTQTDATYRRALIGAFAMLAVGATAASAQMPQRLSDTITLRDGTCMLVSDASDQDKIPEVRGPQRCRIFMDPAGIAHVTVPGNPDETMLFQVFIKPDGTLTGKGREGEGPAAYSCTVTGRVKPGTAPANLPKTNGVIRVWEIPSLP